MERQKFTPRTSDTAGYMVAVQVPRRYGRENLLIQNKGGTRLLVVPEGKMKTWKNCATKSKNLKKPTQKQTSNIGDINLRAMFLNENKSAVRYVVAAIFFLSTMATDCFSSEKNQHSGNKPCLGAWCLREKPQKKPTETQPVKLGSIAKESGLFAANSLCYRSKQGNYSMIYYLYTEGDFLGKIKEISIIDSGLCAPCIECKNAIQQEEFLYGKKIGIGDSVEKIKNLLPQPLAIVELSKEEKNLSKSKTGLKYVYQIDDDTVVVLISNNKVFGLQLMSPDW